MTLLDNELEIITVGKLLDINLAIPGYQRPYRWTTKSTNTLFIDIYDAFLSDLKEYRLGSIILHKELAEDENGFKYNIVDGQQRTTTLAILLYALQERGHALLNETYSDSSRNAIIDNFEILNKRVHELEDDERKKFKEYLLEYCSVVKIVTDNEQEAFQFFDSQNTRGKELKPHDLLKSYHLREMNGDSQYLKLKVISDWEDLDQDNLEDLFKNYLYPSIQWYKNRNGLNYSTSKIEKFKGIKQNNTYDYANYHRASNIFIEQINTNGYNELLNTNYLNQFQLTQPIIAGRRFFSWTLHYSGLLEKIKNIIEKAHDDSGKDTFIPSKRSGDIYIKQLYEISLLFFADRFGLEAIDDATIRQLYTWSYSLRLKMKAVYPATINKYSTGRHERVNENLDMFNMISEMSEPHEIKEIILDKIDEAGIEKDSKYFGIYEKLKEWNGW